MTFKGEPCHCRKKGRSAWLLLGTNMSGLEKLPALLIGKSLNQMRNRYLCITMPIRKLGWHQSFSQSVWRKWKAVTIKFFPPNTTSKLQPLDQGIINNFKMRYCTFVKKLIWHIKEKRPLWIDLLEAMRRARRAWMKFWRTIKNCFKTKVLNIKPLMIQRNTWREYQWKQMMPFQVPKNSPWSWKLLALSRLSQS